MECKITSPQNLLYCLRPCSVVGVAKPPLRLKHGLANFQKHKGQWGVEAAVEKNESVVRRLPIYTGCASLVAVLLNRFQSGISPVADASSSQSRADVLTLILAVTSVLTGLVWISIRPRIAASVKLNGSECKRIDTELPAKLTAEMLWIWESLLNCTCTKSLVIVHRHKCLLQVGMASEHVKETREAVAVDALRLLEGSLCQTILKTGKQNYLANLALYPARFELPFLPQNSQAVILQPIGELGIMIVAGDTIRGFSRTDQAWITLIAEKLDVSLSKHFKRN